MDMKKIVGAAAGFALAALGVYKIINSAPQKYSSKWFDVVSDAVLNEEREKVRQQYCAACSDFNLIVTLENLLRQFDAVLSKRAWGDETPHASSFHREHGWYLPNDD